ncbi:hypothetical protein [Rosenbergiella nectarea]|uniref:hypothetical protein n=1 Tax=Rosenbergiella nectarea TaxID=988801 RepID=UPI001BDAAC9C|nr:hypothetical protein [Rosenbergiella nectarea]MBT0731523.1 hypothetical protein [Rosenbergiella nectarea subsp. apis]
MREKTRSYTTQLPSLNPKDLKAMRQLFIDGAKAVQTTSSAGNIVFTVDGDHYRATIGERVLSLRITTTTNGYGVRHWYVCPHCQNRKAKLFIGRKDLACRDCWGLHYASQSEDRLARMRRTIFKKRAAIWKNYEPARSLFNDCYRFPKPKGMRWETFTEKRAEALELEQRYFIAFRPVLDRINGTIERNTNRAAKALGITL